MKGEWQRNADGSTAFVAEESPEYSEILSHLVETLRRHAHEPLSKRCTPIAEQLTDELSRAFPDDNPELVCRVLLVGLSRISALTAQGLPAALAFNIASEAALKHAGHVPRSP